MQSGSIIKHICILLALSFCTYITKAQHGIGTSTPDASTVLDVSSANKGVLLPRVALTGTGDITTIANAAISLLVYNTATAGAGGASVNPGYYYWTGTLWQRVSNDNLGNHTASQNIQLSGNYLSNDGGNEGIFIATDGKVGIGTNSPSRELHINDGVFRMDRTSNSASFFFHRKQADGTALKTFLFGMDASGVNNGSFFIADNGTAIGGGSTKRLLINNTGNIGIGTTSPGAKLEVAGQIKITGGAPGANKVLTSDANGLATWQATQGDNLGNHTVTQDIALGTHKIKGAGTTPFELSESYLRFAQNQNADSQIRSWGNLALWANDDNGGTEHMIFKVGGTGTGTERMRLNASGNLGIGVTSPSRKLDVNGDVRFRSLTEQNSKETYSSVLVTDNNGNIEKYALSNFGEFLQFVDNSSWQSSTEAISAGNSSFAIVTMNNSVTASYNQSIPTSDTPMSQDVTPVPDDISITNYSSISFSISNSLRSGGYGKKAVPHHSNDDEIWFVADLAAPLSNYIYCRKIKFTVINGIINLRSIAAVRAHYSKYSKSNSELSQTLDAAPSHDIDNSLDVNELDFTIPLGNSNLYIKSNGEWNEILHSNNTLTPDENNRLVNISQMGINTDSPTATLSVNGDANKTGSTAWGTFSDIRLKDIDGDYNKGLQDISALHTVVYNYKKNNPLGWDSTQKQYGLIAQEVQRIFPEAVSTDSNGYLKLDVHPINMAVYNAIRELDAKNQILKQENQNLKNRIIKLDDLEQELMKLKTLVKLLIDYKK